MNIYYEVIDVVIIFACLLISIFFCVISFRFENNKQSKEQDELKNTINSPDDELNIN